MATKRKPSAPVDPAAAPEPPDYEVGYGKPPKHTRFKPGQSGNPKGRPRGQRNLGTIVDEALKERITIREGERRRKVSKLDATVRVIVNNALKGDRKDLAALLQLMRAGGQLGEEPAAPETEPVGADDEDRIIQFLERFSVPVPAEVDASAEANKSPAPTDKAEEKGS